MRRTNGSFIGLSVVLIACSGNGTGEKSTGNSGGSANSESTVQTGGKTAACETGNEGCPCYPNKTCNDDLTCASRLCVSLGAGGNSGNPSSNAQGGTIAIAGSEVTVVGGTISTGGTGSSNGGQPSVGGSLTLGGTSATGSNVGNGGKTSAGSDSGGTTSSGGTSSSSSAVSAGGTRTNVCTSTGADGKLLKPPSQGFEDFDFGDWTTTASHTSALSVVPNDGTACEGNGYLTVDGSQRITNWDGPSINILPYVTLGHTYRYSIATRLSPASAPASAKILGLIVARKCLDITIVAQYAPITSVAVFTNWVRIIGQFTPELPPGCTELGGVHVYLESSESAAPYASLDLDDFVLTDITPTGTGVTSG